MKSLHSGSGYAGRSAARGDGDALALTAGQRLPALAGHRKVPMRQAQDEFMRLPGARSGNY
jgi:hypothetical protein